MRNGERGHVPESRLREGIDASFDIEDASSMSNSNSLMCGALPFQEQRGEEATSVFSMFSTIPWPTFSPVLGVMIYSTQGRTMETVEPDEEEYDEEYEEDEED